MKMFRPLGIAVLSLAFACAAMGSSIVLLPDIGNLTLTAVTTVSPFSIDSLSVSGNQLAMMMDPGPVGTFGFTDLGGPTPNVLVYAVNLPPTEGWAYLFDFSTLSVNGSSVSVLANGAPVSPITDPALQLLTSPLLFTFQLTDTSSNPDQNQETLFFGLTDVQQVPEPATTATVIVGLLGFAAVRLRKVRRGVQ